jgi:hypothetical protein
MSNSKNPKKSALIVSNDKAVPSGFGHHQVGAGPVRAVRSHGPLLCCLVGVLVLVNALLFGPAAAQDTAGTGPEIFEGRPYSPYADRAYPTNVYFGDTHVIKGWLDTDGRAQEKVYDVAWSNGRKPGTDGKLPAVGDTVDLTIPSWTNTIGASELGTVWTDPDFDPSLRAFYYARVIEIPTPRWTAYDRVKFKLDLPKGIPLKTQERAYTSPIWYSPKG